MPPKCNIYFQKGVEAGLLEGKMTSEDMAACNIYRIQKRIPAPGLGKPGGKRSTRRGRKAARSTRRMRGGAGPCVALVRRLLPDERDYGRMQDYDCSAIVPGQDYDAWVARQMEIVNALSEAECSFVAAVCQRIIAGRLSHMDMESCSVFGTAGVFFDQAGNLVTWNNR